MDWLVVNTTPYFYLVLQYGYTSLAHHYTIFHSRQHQSMTWTLSHLLLNNSAHLYEEEIGCQSLIILPALSASFCARKEYGWPAETETVKCMRIRISWWAACVYLQNEPRYIVLYSFYQMNRTYCAFGCIYGVCACSALTEGYVLF